LMSHFSIWRKQPHVAEQCVVVGGPARPGDTDRGVGDVEDASGIDCDGRALILAVDDGANHALGIGHQHIVGFNLLPLTVHHV